MVFFFQKLREISPSSLNYIALHIVENSSKILLLFLRQNQLFFRQSNVLTKEVIKELISQKIFERDRGARIIELFHPKKNREIK